MAHVLHAAVYFDVEGRSRIFQIREFYRSVFIFEAWSFVCVGWKLECFLIKGYPGVGWFTWSAWGCGAARYCLLDDEGEEKETPEKGEDAGDCLQF